MAINGSRSSFPQSVDQFTELFDLPYNKMQAATQLNDLRSRETLTNAEQEQVISLTTQLNEYLLTPERLNKLYDGLFNLETFFLGEVDGYIKTKQALWDTYVNAFKSQGDWVAGKAYKFQNLVTNVRGDLYLCKVNHTSTTANQPSEVGDTTQWSKIGSRGLQGIPGVTGLFKGGWNIATNYLQNDSVYSVDTGESGGVLYIAKRANVGKNPTTSPDDWFLVTTHFVGSSEPVGAATGTHFIRVTG